MAAGDITAVRSKASDVYSAASFDGVDDKVTFTSPTLNSITSAITISLWVNFKSIAAGEAGILNHGYNSNGSFMIYRDTANITVVFKNKVGAVKDKGFSNLTTNTWYHFLVTWNGTNLIFYKNGANPQSGALSGSLGVSSDLLIGNWGVAWHDGMIKDVKIWDRVLTADEIAADYAGTNITEGQILWVPLKDDYNDKSTFGLTGTNSGTYLTNTLTNKIKADMTGLNLGAATDKIIALPRRGSPTIVTANRAAA